MVQKRKAMPKPTATDPAAAASTSTTAASKSKSKAPAVVTLPRKRLPRAIPAPSYADPDSDSSSASDDPDEPDFVDTPSPSPVVPTSKKRTAAIASASGAATSNSKSKPAVTLPKRLSRAVPEPSYADGDSDDPETPVAPPPKKRPKKLQNESLVPKSAFPPNSIKNLLMETKKLTSKNLVHNLYEFQYGPSSKNPYHAERITSIAIQNDIKTFDVTSIATRRFERRITEVSWHPKIPYMVAAACKGGDLGIWKGNNKELIERNRIEPGFPQIFGMKGRGPGGAIFAIRFEERNHESMYIAGLEGTVQKWNLDTEVVEKEFYNTHDYHIWYTSMDVSESTRTLLAGDTKGICHLSTLDGEHVRSVKLHRGKILHCEFNPVVPHLIATSSLDHTVKLWDLRAFQVPLCELPHEKGANVARFNPRNGSRLLTSDQKDEIRVYQGPDWNENPILTISHPHRQFQHLTAITANWHPKADIIVIGRYPVVPRGDAAPPRPIDFFSVGTELERFDLEVNKRNLEPFHELHHSQNDIISLNHFNPSGDMLASGQGRSLVLWKGYDLSNKLPKPPSVGTKKRNAGEDSSLRFNSRRGPTGSDSDDSGSDYDDDAGAGARTNRVRNGGAVAKAKGKATKPKPKAKPMKKDSKK